MRPGPRSARSRSPAGPNFSKPFQGKSKLFQGNSKLFQAFSKDFQTFSLAVSNEINALAATPAILPFSKPSRRNSRRSQSAPGERRAIAERSAAAADAEALADLRFRLPRILFFRKENVAGVAVTVCASPFCLATAMEGSCYDS
jgi:hypothetical protein